MYIEQPGTGGAPYSRVEARIPGLSLDLSLWRRTMADMGVSFLQKEAIQIVAHVEELWDDHV